MPQFSSLPETTNLSDLFVRFPKNARPLLEFANAVLRSDGHLSIAERELIAAYISGLNACNFCFASHEIYARAFGIEEGIIDQLLTDIDTAKIDQKLKPILKYVKKLNTLPSKMIPSDAQKVIDAGWVEEALFEAIEVTGLFNMMNRIVEGSGVNFDHAATVGSHDTKTTDKDRLANSYLNFADRIAEQVEKSKAP